MQTINAVSIQESKPPPPFCRTFGWMLFSLHSLIDKNTTGTSIKAIIPNIDEYFARFALSSTALLSIIYEAYKNHKISIVVSLTSLHSQKVPHTGLAHKGPVTITIVQKASPILAEIYAVSSKK